MQSLITCVLILDFISACGWNIGTWNQRHILYDVIDCGSNNGNGQSVQSDYSQLCVSILSFII